MRNRNKFVRSQWKQIATAVLGIVILIGLFSWIDIPKPSNGDCSVENHTFAVTFVKYTYLASTHLAVTALGLFVSYVFVYFASTYTIKFLANAFSDMRMLYRQRKQRNRRKTTKPDPDIQSIPSMRVINVPGDARFSFTWWCLKNGWIRVMVSPPFRHIMMVLIVAIVSVWFLAYFNKVLCVVDRTSSGYRESQVAAVCVGIAVWVALLAVVSYFLPKNALAKYDNYEARNRKIQTVYDANSYDVTKVQNTDYLELVKPTVAETLKREGFTCQECQTAPIAVYFVRHKTQPVSCEPMRVVVYDCGISVIVKFSNYPMDARTCAALGYSSFEYKLTFQPNMATSLTFLRSCIAMEMSEALKFLRSLSGSGNA